MISSFIPLDDCLGSTHTVRVHLDKPITKSLVDHLSAGASLKYYPHFPKPFFRIDHPCFIAQGVTGNDHFRITYLGVARPLVQDAMWSLFPGTTARLPVAPGQDSGVPTEDQTR
ncbi:MAG: hypothetical protein CVU65_11125 [Deltaproteobacteria bacterium HGW-Deltaproteobacteria-22]|nr:MAG: hypothetical protein CVU65_11125 [Deltaproteobacteria bacterium HGW-Deltaproteobacteria-22]